MSGILAHRELRSQRGILRRPDRGIPTYQTAGANKWRARLRQGGAAVIDELRQLRDAHRAHGDAIQGALNYFEANRERMNYRRYRKDHLPIGSGTVESACKHVVAARMKRSGMTWTLERAQHMLQTPRVDHEFTLCP